MAALISPPELQYTTEALQSGRRSDGRTLLQFRDIHLATNVLAQTFGSARVSCAGTDIIAAIKLETGAVDSEERLQITVEV
jgi:exosome complex RNA-binding protein Rrp42 (RNase PH superfamily)